MVGKKHREIEQRNMKYGQVDKWRSGQLNTAVAGWDGAEVAGRLLKQAAGAGDATPHFGVVVC